MSRLVRHCVFLVAIAIIVPAAAQTSDVSALMQENLVDIGGGRSLNLVCIGHGSPTIVFDYGLNGDMLHWRKVVEPVSVISRACFYDRAGYGFSPPSDKPMTADNVTDDLHALLHGAGISGPVVLVGHSLGGLYATLYTDKFGADVAGLVLIDPAFAGQEMPNRAPDAEAGHQAEYEQFQAKMLGCARLARDGKLSREAPQGCFASASNRPLAETDYLLTQFLKPFRYESVAEESANHHYVGNQQSEDSLEEARAATTFGSKPIVVLTAGLDAPDANQSPADHKAFDDNWKAGHDRLAARSTRGESIVVPGAHHLIQLEQPDTVIAAIRRVVIEAREQAANR